MWNLNDILIKKFSKFELFSLLFVKSLLHYNISNLNWVNFKMDHTMILSFDSFTYITYILVLVD